MSKALMNLLLTVVMGILVGCDEKPISVVQEQEGSEKEVLLKYDAANVVTLGNHSYIQVNRDWRPADCPYTILKILDCFEKTHPELEVISWHIEKQQDSKTTSDYTFGIWVDHRPRTPK